MPTQVMPTLKWGFQDELYFCTKDGTDNIYVLTKPLKYWSQTWGLVEVPEGFETDLASVPRLWLIYSIWGDRAHREAVVHDYLYRSDSRPNFKRSDCDKVFLDAMKSRGVSSFISRPMYAGVRLGGWASFHKKKVGDKL